MCCGDGEMGKLVVEPGVGISFNQDIGFEGEKVVGNSP
jgi:hypothetical protein